MTFYGTAAEFENYHEDRGRVVDPAWTSDIVEAALFFCSEWLDNRYKDLWSGYPTDGFTQVRLWPRNLARTNTFPEYLFTDSEIPVKVLYAVYEAAYRELTTAGSLEKDYVPQKYSKVSIVGATSVEYNASVVQASDLQLQIPIVESLMSPLIDSCKIGYSNMYSGGSKRV